MELRAVQLAVLASITYIRTAVTARKRPVMSYTFSFSNTDSVLPSYFDEPIYLDEESAWVIGLISFHTYHSEANIEETNNHLYYRVPTHPTWQELRIPVGAYTIDDLADAIDSLLPKGLFIDIAPSNNTQQCSIHSNVYIDFSRPETFNDLLGFEKIILEPEKTYVSTQQIRLTHIDVLRIHCNLVKGNYDNGDPSHILYEFSATVPPGYKIVEAPHDILYLPINTRTINNIVVTITDQENKKVNFRGEPINVQLHLKRLA